jgi:hypothetical protein
VSPDNPQDAYRWESPQQSGLELTVLNALTDDWQQAFQTAMSEWDDGQPDTLTLQSERVDVDVECEPLTGLLKVCNGDYGETDWLGLNAILFDMERKWILMSTAKMNEFFLSRASAAQRQYTMCHEIGHGFGLPHWDENFYNRNMGNCMDYTSRPRSNQQPSASNFEFLKQLYGEVGGTVQPMDSNTFPAQAPGGDRRLRRRSSSSSTTTTNTSRNASSIPAEVMAAYKAVLNGETLPSSRSQHHRILLESNEDSEASLIDLGYGGYGLLVYKLKPWATRTDGDGDDDGDE